MATRRARLIVALGVLAAALVWGAPQERRADKPLVRKDLLVFGRAEIAPPLRDIFRPVAAATGPAMVPTARPAFSPAPGAAAPTSAPAFDLNISYIGSVKSGGQTLALILRGGQTESVRQGDEIIPGYKVISLTADAIVVQGPTGETRTFQKQGGRP